MTNPSPEQVEAARAEYDRSEDMCAALVAAAGAAPQEREDDNLARASAWSDYRAEYGVHGAQSHRDFCAGWDAARGTLDTGRGQR